MARPDSKGKATLTTARNRLRDQRNAWTVRHPTIDLDTVIQMISSMAYEPGRHGADHRAEATLDDAAATVHLAVALVSWFRAGLLASATR
jgi:hypothetical protein